MTIGIRLLLLFLFAGNFLTAQIIENKLIDYPLNQGISKLLTHDSSFYLAGEYVPEDVKDFGDFNQIQDSLNYALYKYSVKGELIWKLQFGNDTARDIPVDLAIDPDGNVLALIYIESLRYKPKGKNTQLKKISPSGELIWEKSFVGEAQSIRVGSDGTYLLTLYEFTQEIEFNKDEIILLRLNKSGESIWKWNRGTFKRNEILIKYSNRTLAGNTIENGKSKLLYQNFTKTSSDYINNWNQPYDYRLKTVTSNGEIESTLKLENTGSGLLDHYIFTKDGAILSSWIKYPVVKDYDKINEDTIKHYFVKFNPLGKILWKTLLHFTWADNMILDPQILSSVDLNLTVYFYQLNHDSKYSSLHLILLNDKGKVLKKADFSYPEYSFEDSEVTLLQNGNLLIMSSISSYNKKEEKGDPKIHMLQLDMDHLAGKKN